MAALLARGCAVRRRPSPIASPGPPQDSAAGTGINPGKTRAMDATPRKERHHAIVNGSGKMKRDPVAI